MTYCKTHKFKLAWNKSNIVWQCESCPCKKINHAMTKRYNDMVKELGEETANYMFDLNVINEKRA